MTNKFPKEGDRVYVRFASGVLAGDLLFGTYLSRTDNENYPHMVRLDIDVGTAYESPRILSSMDKIGPVA